MYDALLILGILGCLSLILLIGELISGILSAIKRKIAYEKQFIPQTRYFTD